MASFQTPPCGCQLNKQFDFFSIGILPTPESLAAFLAKHYNPKELEEKRFSPWVGDYEGRTLVEVYRDCICSRRIGTICKWLGPLQPKGKAKENPARAAGRGTS